MSVRNEFVGVSVEVFDILQEGRLAVTVINDPLEKTATIHSMLPVFAAPLKAGKTLVY